MLMVLQELLLLSKLANDFIEKAVNYVRVIYKSIKGNLNYQRWQQ